jgi:4-hydroxy-4-methyl-2-oxoglutarate aldolase
MKFAFFIPLLFAFGSLSLLSANDAAEDPRAGQSFIPTEIYSLDEDRAVLAAFEGLRVADVSDGLDAVGMMGNMLVDPEIHPLWKDPIEYRHRIIGIAVTARYVPSNEPLPGVLPEAEFDAWVGNFYNEKSSEPFMELLREGSVLVIDDTDNDVGSIGSANILMWKRAGAVGVVTDSTSRDTDEIITQQIPLYYRGPGRGIRPGRNEIESVNRPVVIGDVQVRPGDVVVADGDGVVVVPREVALKVAAYAHKIIEGDKAARRDLYESLGLPTDPSLE